MAEYTIKVRNAPEDWKDYKYMVARAFEGELWYYGVFDDYDRAKMARDEVDGFILVR